MESDNFVKEKHDELMPYKVEILKADNGFLVTVGCRQFVKEGGENVLNDVLRYLGGDKEVVKKYGFDGNNLFSAEEAFRTQQIRAREEEDEKKAEYTNSDSAFSEVYRVFDRESLGGRKGRLIETIYEVGNGLIIIDYKRKMAFVREIKKEEL